MVHYVVNSKVFETEEEARQFSKDFMERGIIVGYSETTDPVTHYYLGDGMACPIEDYFGLIREAKRAKGSQKG